MKVGLLNQTHFSANNQNGTQTNSTDNKELNSIKYLLRDNHSWRKIYYPKQNQIGIQSAVAYDMPNYTILSDGTVIAGITLGKPKPSIVLEKNKDMADYVSAVKEQNRILNNNSDIVFLGNSKVVENPTDNNIQRKKHKSLKERTAGIWKFISATGQMINATTKGLVYAAATGITLLTGSWLFKSLPKALSKEKPTLWNTIRHPLKNISKSGKLIAAVGSALVLGYHIIKGKMDANQKTAVIDHKMKTGHRDK